MLRTEPTTDSVDASAGFVAERVGEAVFTDRASCASGQGLVMSVAQASLRRVEDRGGQVAANRVVTPVRIRQLRAWWAHSVAFCARRASGMTGPLSLRRRGSVGAATNRISGHRLEGSGRRRVCPSDGSVTSHQRAG